MDKNLSFISGSEVWHKNILYIVEHAIDFNLVVVVNKANNMTHTLPINELTHQPDNHTGTFDQTSLDLSNINDMQWEIAKKRFSIIKPLLVKGRTKEQVNREGKKHGVHSATLYRWIKLYEDSELLTSLLPNKRGSKVGQVRLKDTQKTIIETTINDTYLTKQKRSIQQTYIELQRRCRHAQVKAPHINTLRNWVNRINDQLQIKKREGHKTHRDKFHLNRSEFPGANVPLSIIQIDHTPLDIIVVDEYDRLPIGRPWVTMAIDVYSRVVIGFYISMDSPSAASVGLCLANSILPKEAWLSSLGVETHWPVWGLPSIIHADNAKEFRGKVLRMACEQYDIDLQWRPVATPHYGGHIERLLGTFSKDIHALPGSTFSNSSMKGNYDSNSTAAFTILELEKWLTTLVCDVYHNKVHSSLLMSPIKKYQEGIFGDDNTPGIGLPDKVIDETKLKLDFMPFVERTIQQYGISIDNIIYNGDVLKCWVNAKEDGGSSLKRKFIIRRDPRNISVIYFYDPDLKQYFDIPYSNPTRPVISLWELKEVRRRLKTEGIESIDEDSIFKAYDKLHNMVESSVKKTQKARRQSYRLKNKPDTHKLEEHKLDQKNEPQSEPITDIKPFDDLEIL